MPGREPVCYCGVTRSEAPAAWRGETEEPPRRGLSPLAVVVLMAAAGLGVYAAMRMSDSAHTAALPAEAPAATTQPSAPAPPVSAEGRATEPPPRATTTLMPLSAARPADAAPAAARPAAVDTAPSPTAMEEAWARATALLDRPLQGIASNTSALEQDAAAFAHACLSSPGGNWLASMKTAPIVTGTVPFVGNARLDCEAERRKLVARADAVKAQLDELDRQARVNSVLPGHWRQLLASHALEIWDRY